MRRVLLILVLMLGTSIQPVFSADGDLKLPNIFIYSIPDEIKQKPDVPDDIDAPEDAYINEVPVSDKDDDSVLPFAEEINLSLDDLEPEETLSATTLKGYAEFIEDADAIYLRDDNNQYVLNLKVPQKITTQKSLDLQSRTYAMKRQNLAKYSKEEYMVEDKNIQSVDKFGHFSIGTAYGQEVDNISMLENSTSLFTKYEREKFVLSSKFEKTMNTTIGTYSDSFSFAPEWKLNNYISIKEVLSANISKNRRSSELVFSVSPYGHKGSDRLRLEIGAKHTINQDNSLYGTQLNFSTKFKL